MQGETGELWGLLSLLLQPSLPSKIAPGPLCVPCAGAKGVQGESGELWGLLNLLQLTADRIRSKEVLEQRAQQEQFSVEELQGGEAEEEEGGGPRLVSGSNPGAVLQ